MKKQVIPGPEARKQLLAGAELLYSAVSTTLGPKGNNAVIETYGEPIVTHDGVTVAKAVEVTDKSRPGIRVGVEMIKASSSKTNDNVGDGTTSSTILAYHLIESGLGKIEAGMNPMVLRRELSDASKKVLAKLETLGEPVDTKQSMINVATVSCENTEIGKKIGSLYYDLGKNPAVSVELGSKEDILTFIDEGYSFDRGLLSSSMVSDIRSQSTTIKNPSVLVFDGTVKSLNNLAQDLWNEGKNSLVVICAGVSDEVIEEALVIKNKFQVIAIKAPGFGEEGKQQLKDLAAFTGTEVFRKFEDVDHRKLGACDKIVASTKETIITGGQDVSKYIEDLEARKTESELEKQKLDKRIRKLRAKVGRIEVGGATEMEAEERKYLVDDAVAAVEAAITSGIVPGGATTYIELSKELTDETAGEEILKDSLLSPFKVLLSNAGERYGVIIEQLKPGQGYNVTSGEIVDLKEQGIIDPVMVIKQAITNAVSVAESVLTTGVLIVREEEDDKEKE